MSTTRGIARERAVRRLLESEGWWVCRAAGSIGDADLVALKHGHTPRLIEVKSTARGPFHGFGPKDRAELLDAATRAGTSAELCWWPPRQQAQWIGSEHWPNRYGEEREHGGNDRA